MSKLLPVALVGGALLLLSGRKSRRSAKKVVPEDVPTSDFECDPLDPDTWPEGFGCFFDSEEGYILLPSRDWIEPEKFKCDRMLYNGYCIELSPPVKGAAHPAMRFWLLRIRDGEGNLMRLRADQPEKMTPGRDSMDFFKSEGEALAYAYDKIDSWTL